MSAVQEYGWAARELLDLAGRETPETPGVCPSYMNLGIVFAGFDDLKTAEQLFAKAKECLDPPRQSFLAIHWADVMLRGDRPMEALTLLRDARDKYPDNLDCRWAYARTLVKMKMFPEAREEYESLLKLPDLAAEGRAMLEKELASLQGK
jgi:tetratricopeptide (TPR) repeat protein